VASILVIEDIPANMALAAKLLQVAGHEVLRAVCAADGIALAQDRLPDLVLMDLGLPDMDGTQAMKALRADPRTTHLRVVAFTAYAMPSDQDRAFADGFDGYISKPIDFATFANDVAELLP
jgi:two-component system, cell cycle response regulator DivK